MNILLAIVWGISGIATLWSGDIGRIEYGLMWVALMLVLIRDICERAVRKNEEK